MEVKSLKEFHVEPSSLAPKVPEVSSHGCDGYGHCKEKSMTPGLRGATFTKHSIQSLCTSGRHGQCHVHSEKLLAVLGSIVGVAFGFVVSFLIA